jgi:hypothetical protein
MSIASRTIAVGVPALIVGLTLATAYIHFWVGGTLLLLNAAGYAALAGAFVASSLFYRRATPLVLLALAGYAATTIAGWAVMGPYFDIAYLAKGIEVALIGVIALQLGRMRAETRAAIRSVRSWLDARLEAVTRRSPRPAASAARGEE